jgi:hypothetical protein
MPGYLLQSFPLSPFGLVNFISSRWIFCAFHFLSSGEGRIQLCLGFSKRQKADCALGLADCGLSLPSAQS